MGRGSCRWPFCCSICLSLLKFAAGIAGFAFISSLLGPPPIQLAPFPITLRLPTNVHDGLHHVHSGWHPLTAAAEQTKRNETRRDEKRVVA